MSQDHVLFSRSFEANAASLATKQYYGVKLGAAAGYIILCASQGENILGVLLDKPARYESGRVAMLGTVKCIVSEAIATLGTEITVDANGKFEAAASSDVVIGHNLEVSTADGDIIEVFLDSRYVKA